MQQQKQSKINLDDMTIVFDCGCTINVETFDYEGKTWISEGTTAEVCEVHTKQMGATFG